MSEATMPEESPSRKEYPYKLTRASAWLAWSLMGFFLLVPVLCVYLWYLSHSREVLALWLAALFVLFDVWQLAVIYVQSKARLVTSPEGLEFFSPGYNIRTQWDNLAEIKKASVLTLRQNPTVHSSSALRWLWLRPWKRKVLPLYLFKGWWPGELEQDFKQYAPHLFSGS